MAGTTQPCLQVTGVVLSVLRALSHHSGGKYRVNAVPKALTLPVGRGYALPTPIETFGTEPVARFVPSFFASSRLTTFSDAGLSRQTGCCISFCAGIVWSRISQKIAYTKCCSDHYLIRV
jgi:hypothetical protein